MDAFVVVRWRSFISDRVRVPPFLPEPSTQRATFAFAPLFRLVFLRACALLVYRCFPSGFSLLVSPLPLAVTYFADDFSFCISIPLEVVPARFLLFPFLLRLVNKLLKMSMLLRRPSFLISFALLRGEARQRLRQRPEISANTARHARDAVSRRRFEIAVGGVRFFLRCWGFGLAGVFPAGLGVVAEAGFAGLGFRRTHRAECSSTGRCVLDTCGRTFLAWLQCMDLRTRKQALLAKLESFEAKIDGLTAE